MLLGENQTSGRTSPNFALRAVTIALMAGFGIAPAMAADPEIEQLKKMIEAQQQQIEALKQQVESASEKATAAEAAVASAPSSGAHLASGGPEVSFGGQYRINSYSADNDDGSDNQTASRARIRQNIDIKFNERFKTHLQFELGHTTDNVTTTSSSDRGNDVSVRHAVMDYTTASGINLQAGLVPLSDHFGDSQFSGDWDYNPVAVSVSTPLGSGKLRGFAASLRERTEHHSDDVNHYQLDYVLPLSGRNQINVGGSYAVAAMDSSLPNGSYYSAGVGGQFGLGDNLLLKGFLIASHTDRELLKVGAGDGSGAAVKLELGGKLGRGDFGLMATHATGDKDGGGFMPVNALVGANGYWGYTGILTIQGPTDTGIDGDSVNISNNGYGLTTVQAKYAFPIMQDLSGYVGAGWFGNTDAPDGRDSTVGYDLIAMGTYRFNKELALDFGYSYAKLHDSVSGYWQGSSGGFNSAPGVERDKQALFARLQAEF